MLKTKKKTRILFIILLSTFLFPSNLISQNNYKRKISISEWIQEMEKAKDKEFYFLSNTQIYYNAKTDTLYSWSQPKTKPTAKDSINTKNIYPAVVLENCNFLGGNTVQLRNIIFHNNISFSDCEGAGQLYIYNCTFKQGLDIFNSDFNWICFMYSSILQRTIVFGLKMSELRFLNCTFSTDYKVVKSSYIRGYEKENHIAQYLFIFSQNEKKINSIYFNNCKVLPTEVKPIIIFEGGKYDVISFNEVDFGKSIVNFMSCSAKEDFTVVDCKFTNAFGMVKFNFPKDNTSFNWSQIDSLGLGLYRRFEKPPYTGKTDTLSSDVDIFNELNSSYRKLHSMYRNQGDMESANACYKQIKDMETTKYRYLYQNSPSINTWFNWRFNQFLKIFSEYGTNPVQSLIFSMWTILLFAAVYFFFYSAWDGINRTYLINKHRQIMQYFRSEQRLEDFYTENYIEDLKVFADYKKEIKESKIQIPLFIFLLGKPLYFFSLIKYKVVSFIYRRTELLQGRWTDLESTRKVFVGTTVFFSVIIYLVFLAFIRALNATILSINAFSTLGFGSIPVKGASRYITILEGFLGWFLLSIFSVSLISQMIQN